MWGCLQRFVSKMGHITSPITFAKKLEKMIKILSGFLIVGILISSCVKSDSVNQTSCSSSYDPCALKASAAEIDSVEAYLASKGITDAVKHCSGMYYKIDSVGTGKTAGIC